MYSYILFYILIILLGYLGYKHNVKTAYRALIPDGDFVIVSPSSFARDTRFFKQRVKRSDIVKIQISDSCVSLFNKSDHAIDIWLPNRKAIKVIADKAENIFAHAKVVNVCS